MTQCHKVMFMVFATILFIVGVSATFLQLYYYDGPGDGIGGTPSCTEGERRCDKSTVQECQSGTWIDMKTCGSSELCQNGQCEAAPISVALDSTPSGTLTKESVTINGTVNLNARVSYTIDNGNWETVCSSCNTFNFTTNTLSPGSHTIQVNATSPANASDTESVSFTLADGTELSFKVGVDKSFPQSAIPIAPQSDLWPRSTDVDFNYYLESGSKKIDISDVDDGICDFTGDTGWEVEGVYYCKTLLPKNIQAGDYALVAEWNLRGSHRRVLDNSFPVKGSYIWTDAQSGHGGHIPDSQQVTHTPALSQDSKGPKGNTVTCTGSTFQLKGIGQLTSQCNNGVTTQTTPAVVAWVYKNGKVIDISHNNMFNDNCQFHDITRQTLLNAEKGYLPKNCNIDWQFGGNSQFGAHTFDSPGKYSVQVDFLNAVSDSPDYICPTGATPPTICSVGTMKNDAHGLEGLANYDVTIVDPTVEVANESIPGTVEEDGVHLLKARHDSNGSIRQTFRRKFVFENTGHGEAEITDVSLQCPDAVNCSVRTALPLTLDTGENVSVSSNFTMPKRKDTYTLTATITVDDAYGLECQPEKTFTRSVSVRWRDIYSPEVSCDRCHSFQNNEVAFAPNITDPEPSAGFGEMRVCADASCSTIACRNTNGTSCTAPMSQFASACSAKEINYWIYAKDALFNEKQIQAGSFFKKKAFDCRCSFDDQCATGLCKGNPARCSANPTPIIDLE